MQPEGLRESSRWSENHQYRVVPTRTLKGCQTSPQESCTHAGCCSYFNAFRWSSLRSDHRLLSRSPSGCGAAKTRLGTAKTRLGTAKTHVGYAKRRLGSAKTHLGYAKTRLGSAK